jgi:diguanylate cyclase (GGDEF)-like protein
MPTMAVETEKPDEMTPADGALPRMYWGYVAAYTVLCAAHLVAQTRDSAERFIGSDTIVGLIQWLTLSALIWRWRRSSFPNTFRWGVVIVALAFINLANANDLAMHLRGGYSRVPGASIFCDAIYTVMIVLSCSTTFRGRAMRATNLIDGALAMALTGLFFIRTFSLVSLNGTGDMNDILFIVRMFDVLGIFITLCACVRLLGVETAPCRHFFFVLTAYLLTSTLFAAVRNRLILTGTSPFLELMLLPQYVVFGLLCLRPSPRWLESYHPNPPLVYVTESLSPLFLGLGLLGVSISILSHHPALGAIGASIAVIGYGIRNVITQSEQMVTERTLLQLQGQLQSLVVTDSLTGIANRRCFDQTLEREWNRVTRTQDPLSMLLIDIDFFKNLNDQYGHRKGDQCLVAIAAALESASPRSGDLVARYGGEEFAVILPSTHRNGAESVARRMQQAVWDLMIQNETSIGPYATISIGIATYEFPQPGSPSALIEAADRALYTAKRNGRNRVEHFPLQHIANTG